MSFLICFNLGTVVLSPPGGGEVGFDLGNVGFLRFWSSFLELCAMKVLLAPDEIQFFQVPGIARSSQNMPQEVKNMVDTLSTPRGSTPPEVFLNLWVSPELYWRVP